MATADTPAMKQYKRFKAQHPGCVLFFRMGDFYEMFYEDADLAHRVLGITLSQRTAGVPMAGVPHHSVEGYLKRMIQAGHRVAVCEQTQDPKEAKGVVDRDVTRVVSPGTLTDEALMDAGEPAAVAAAHPLKDGRVALAWAELSTGAFGFAAVDADEAAGELARLSVAELLFSDPDDGSVPPATEALRRALDVPASPRPGYTFRPAEAVTLLKRQFGVADLGGFGLGDDDPALPAVGAVLAYLHETQRTDPQTGRLPHLQPPRRLDRAGSLIIDAASLASLEVVRTQAAAGASGETAGSLLGVLSGNGKATRTPMGGRLLRRWLCFPLRDAEAIGRRQDVVASLADDGRFVNELSVQLKRIQDVPRIAGRLGVGRLTPRDLVALGRSVAAARTLAEVLGGREPVAPFHDRLDPLVGPLMGLAETLDDTCLQEDAPSHLRAGGVFCDGFDRELDAQRDLMQHGDRWLAAYQQEMSEKLGIPVKVGFNKVFGYYLELTAVQAAKLHDRDAATAGWTRKQTLKNAERYITAELKDHETRVLAAEDRAIARELELFAGLCDQAAQRIPQLQAYAELAAELDVLLLFAERAAKGGHCRPTLVDGPVLDVAGGRHPALDELLGTGFVANAIHLGGAGRAPLALLTGPNMAGKSTYIRQAALLTLLAHTGAFLPAESATVGLTDRIFTRVGAQDQLHAGRSTFMVEMTEAAEICRHAGPHSLVILDEIGRGTSTYDGLSLAWAIAEHLEAVGCRTLFATHYHELTALAGTRSGIANLHVKARPLNGEMVFLHTVEPGATDRSYGVEVARLAGMPPAVTDRAGSLLEAFEEKAAGSADRVPPPPQRPTVRGAARSKPLRPPKPQLALFGLPEDHPVLSRLAGLGDAALSPGEAEAELDALRTLLRG
ncbi:DNA mismatch repair protein MutS [Phycisphaera mikurensis]|uniref:DNA mismatch repair protein MutS n=1 Tax=Phycisphaera mikurensis (strain NBRC 102666 / KCTC 22515 / FYK2301M01) TaxID=1142394 RepID=I0IH70_PHYMF|nr:DNA mismatch repair protein MutS [Phycisphaera mikurensis]MBB6440859.1 DNA mismatch repair protein MutS [Phycisphaera mikurensis]BAM04608.1 DNA mismatch repair protein MutS [Phycisphaera mikurensis NBRC 102666]